MPSLRNRKVKGRIRQDELVINPDGEFIVIPHTFSDDSSVESKRFSKLWNNKGSLCETTVDVTWYYADEDKPTIDEYVEGKCFGCGKKTGGKYCGISCRGFKREEETLYEYSFPRMFDVSIKPRPDFLIRHLIGIRRALKRRRTKWTYALHKLLRRLGGCDDCDY